MLLYGDWYLLGANFFVICDFQVHFSNFVTQGGQLAIIEISTTAVGDSCI